jgi:hypothetical protein
MTGQNIIAWESVTANHIRKHILRGEIEPELLTLHVGTNIVGQTLPNDNAAQSSGRRYLQESGSSLNGLIVQFDVAVTYRSVGTDHDMSSLVFGAWDTDIDREDYIRTLLDQTNGLGQITDVAVEVKGFVPPEPKKGNKVNLAVIIGAAVGGAAFIFLVAFYLLRRESSDKEEEQRSHHRETTTKSMTTPETTQKIAVST